MLLVILFSSQLFTNALEHFGHRIKISAGVTGSIFAAVATALPETMIPIIAIVAGTSDKIVNEEISVGAILGAPLMLSTISTGLMAIFAIQGRGLFGKISPEKNGFKRDLNFFLVALFFAAAAMYAPLDNLILRASISALLVLLYATYVVCTLRASKQLVKDGHGVMPDQPLLMTKLKLKTHLGTIIFQLLLGFILLLGGAKGFIDDIVIVSHTLAVSPLLLSILIIPIATELPEKINSIFWIRRRKDTLAFGNITGAMVFQGTLLPALGILLTPWQPVKAVWLGICVTFFAGCWLRFNAIFGGLWIPALLLNGFIYLIYLYLMF